MTESPLTRLVRALLLAGVAVVLVGLVAVAATGHSFGGGGSSQPTPYAIDTILTILFGLFAIAAVVLLVGTFWVGLDVRRHRRSRPPAALRPSFWITFILGALVLLAVLRIHPNRDRLPVTPQPPAAGSTEPAEGARRRQDPQFQWVPFVAVFGAAGVAALGFYLAERRRKRRLPAELPAAEALIDVLDETLADLRAESDPRRAVIAAYARMERALAAYGVARRQFEAPHEYLGRVLAELTGGGRAAKRLTALFERARFSTHEIDQPMQAEAIDAVEDLQAELVALEAEKAAKAA